MLVDTNVLIHAAVEGPPEHAACRGRLEELRHGRSPFFSTWPIFYECLRVLTHRRALPRPRTITEAWSFLEAILRSPAFSLLTPTARHAEIVAATFDELPELAGSVLHDAHTAILMREHGVSRILTRDTDFHRFPFLTVIDPLRERP